MEDGWNALVGSDSESILEAIEHFGPKSKKRDVFGDGKAAESMATMIGGIEE